MSKLDDELELLSKPGDTIIDTLEFMGITTQHFAERLDMPLPVVTDMINGLTPLTEFWAKKLEEFFGISAEFWMNREKNYRAKLEKLLKKKGKS